MVVAPIRKEKARHGGKDEKGVVEGIKRKIMLESYGEGPAAEVEGRDPLPKKKKPLLEKTNVISRKRVFHTKDPLSWRGGGSPQSAAPEQVRT